MEAVEWPLSAAAIGLYFSRLVGEMEASIAGEKLVYVRNVDSSVGVVIALVFQEDVRAVGEALIENLPDRLLATARG